MPFPALPFMFDDTTRVRIDVTIGLWDFIQIMGALEELCSVENWEPYGEEIPAEAFSETFIGLTDDIRATVTYIPFE